MGGHEGNYLGEVKRPDVGRLFQPFWRDDVLLLVVEDELGTPMVKRFRFQLPGGEAVEIFLTEAPHR